MPQLPARSFGVVSRTVFITPAAKINLRTILPFKSLVNFETNHCYFFLALHSKITKIYIYITYQTNRFFLFNLL